MLKEAALQYFNQGLNIVPVKTKKPLVEWSKWQTERQTQQEFDSLPFNEADGFATVCGTKADNGFYFLSIDADTSEFDFKLLPITAFEKTPRGGYHFYYWSRTNARGNKNHLLKVELLGLGNIVIVYPTIGYKRENDNTPTQVNNLNDIFQSLIVKLGGKPKQELVDVQKLLEGVKNGERDDASIRIATYFRKHGLTQEQAFTEILEWDKKNEAPLGYQILMAKVESAFKTEEPYSFRFKDDKLNPIVLAKEIMQDYTFLTPKTMETTFYFNKKKGIYEPGESIIKMEMAKRWDENVRNKYYPDVLFYIKAKTYTENLTVSPYFIACENGVLNVVSKEIMPFDQKLFITARVPVTYDVAATCAAIHIFLNEVVGEEQKQVIQEMMGYCLLQNMPYHKAFMFIGDGANGKSTLLNLLKAFLGAENCSNVTLQNICNNRFSTANLRYKLANLCADLPDSQIVNSGAFKMLTGADTISAEFKHQNPFTFVNYAKLIFSANKIPQTTEDTLAFFRRWLIITCDNVFMGEKCDPKILDRLTIPTELSGLLNFALEGLKRLLENGKFSINETIEDLRSQYIRKSNSAKAFIEERLEQTQNAKDFIEETELYQNYILFCNKEKLPTMQKRSFTINMQQFCPQVIQTKERILGTPTPVYQYVKIKTVPSVPSSLFNSKILPYYNKNIEISKPERTERTDDKRQVKVKHVIPAEQCEFCKTLSVEWELYEDGVQTIRMCNNCFVNARKSGDVKFSFIEDGVSNE